MSGALAVIGGGSWGTALARHAARGGREVRLWFHDAALEAAARGCRENPTYLPGKTFPSSLRTSADLEEVVGGADGVILAVPSHHLRGVVRACGERLQSAMPILIATKGLEADTLRRMSEVVREEVGGDGDRIAVLSGPSFAAEVAGGHPTAVVVAAGDESVARAVQRDLSHGNLRIYRNADLIGVEVGGALKNVVAIAAGILEGLGYGTNTAAALLTRGLHEITRLAVALGGERSTLAGLAGMGDLIVTCTGRLSRNRHVGVELGAGRPLDEILAGMKMVAEGVRTARGAVALARRERVELPIAERVAAVLFDGLAPREAVRDLLARDPKEEMRL
jgi:glycerol-3-phosphate dehydrogenase (NAD(P)+)